MMAISPESSQRSMITQFYNSDIYSIVRQWSPTLHANAPLSSLS